MFTLPSPLRVAGSAARVGASDAKGPQVPGETMLLTQEDVRDVLEAAFQQHTGVALRHADVPWDRPCNDRLVDPSPLAQSAMARAAGA